MSSKLAYGWLDDVSTSLHCLFDRMTLSTLPGALALAARITDHPPFAYANVYVKLTEGELTVAQLVALTSHIREHPRLGGKVIGVYGTSDGKGFLFVSTALSGATARRAFMKLVEQAFSDLGFETKFTSNGGHEDFAAER